MFERLGNWRRGRRFRGERKVLFLDQIANDVESQIPLDEVLAESQREDDDEVIREVSAMMKQSLLEYGNPSQKPMIYGYLSRREHALIKIGYEKKSLPFMINVILKDIESEEQSVMAMILAQGENLIGIALMLFIAVELAPLGQIYSEQPLLFKITGFLSEAWPLILAVLLLLLFLYAKLKKEVVGETREALKKFGFFYLSDRLDERRFLAIGEGLCRTQLPATSFYQVAKEAMSDRAYFLESLSVASNLVGAGNLTQSLKHTVTNRAFRSIKAKARTNAMTDIADGFALATKNHEKRLDISYKRTSKSIELVIAILLVSIMLPLVLVLFGAGIDV